MSESKKVRNQRDPNQDHKCGLIFCMLVSCQSAQTARRCTLTLTPAQQPAAGPPVSKTHGATQLTSDYFWTASAGPSPPPVHKSQHDVYTTKLLRFLSLSKYLGTKSECFLGKDRLRQAQHNDIFRDRPWLSKMQCFWQMSQSTITKIKIHRARGRRRLGGGWLLWFLGQSYWGISGFTSYLCHISAIWTSPNTNTHAGQRGRLESICCYQTNYKKINSETWLWALTECRRGEQEKSPKQNTFILQF